MTRKLQDSLQITKLARDLNINAQKDPVTGILDHCEERIQAMIADVDDLDTLSELLDWVANKAGTSFRMVRNEQSLRGIQQELTDKGETAFANLEGYLSQDVFGFTYKLQNSDPWSHQFVSIIDCRGVKKARAYFTKWHEIAHLLTMTQQTRLVFRRTHPLVVASQEPEELLMDRIAGRFGFYGPIFHKAIEGEISFNEIDRLRVALCPEASLQASLINFVKYWPTPCVHLKAEVAFNKKINDESVQRSFDFMHLPEPVLSSFQAFPNDEARKSGLVIFNDSKVPANSIFYRVVYDDFGYAEAEENLRDWTGRRSMKIKVKARINAGIVEALIIPA